MIRQREIAAMIGGSAFRQLARGDPAMASGKRMSLRADSAGGVAVYVTLLIAVLVGMVGLAIDSARFVTVNTQAQAAADGAAIAAASQLDGSASAIARATMAAQTTPLVQNRQTIATGAAVVQISAIRFLRRLPADSVRPIPAADYTTDPLEARFSEVTTQTLTQNNLFIRVVGAAATAATAATAVAGYTQVICRIPPLAICNPGEAPPPAGTGLGANFDVDAWRGKQILIKASGPGAGWVPGNFGLLDSPTGQGARDIAELLASSNPNSVCVGNTVDLKPGQTQGASTGINTRFDMFDNPFFGAAAARNNPNYRPARNVTKGLVRTNPCTYAAPALPNQAMSLPRDSNLSAANRFGNGAWNCAAYWAINHPSVPAPAGCTNPASISRYAIYRHEIATAIPNNAPAGEDGNPRCYSGPAVPEQPDRRVVYFAVINCLEQGPIRGNASGVKVKAFAKAFVTEPVGNPPDSDFYLEVIDVVKPGADDGVLHDIVQIYR